MRAARAVRAWLAAASCVALAVCSCAALTACGVGPPPGFPAGDRWMFPLVDPLEDGVLVTPVMIDGHGPYLFAIDPDSSVSAVDTQVVKEAHLRVGKGPLRADETGVQQERVYTEMPDVKVGTLTFAKRAAMVIPVGTYDAGGRHLAGVLGRDVIDDALIFGFNRDQGVAMILSAKEFHPPDGGIELEYRASPNPNGELEMPPPPRRLVRAAVNGTRYSLHVDLGATDSQLRASHWGNAELVPVPAKLVLVDEAATPRQITHAGLARSVSVAGVTRYNTVFVPYEDERWETDGADGTLGLGFFAPFTVWASWDRSMIYLVGRDDSTPAVRASRLARWGKALPTCPHPGCVTATVAAGDAVAAPLDGAGAPSAPADPAAAGAGSAVPATTPPASPATATPVATAELTAPWAGGAGVTVTVTRDAEAARHALQVVLSPKLAAAAPPPAAPAAPAALATATPAPAWIVVNLGAAADQATRQLGPEYAGATFDVIDVSPFPKACPDSAASCIALFSPQGLAAGLKGLPSGQPDDGSPPPLPPSAPPVHPVPPDKLHRRTGDAAIAPNEASRQAIAAAGTAPAVAIVKVCLTSEGKVDTDKIIKTSKVPAYDQQLLDDVKNSWTFDPVVANGSPAAVCSSFTFKLQQ